MLRDQLAQANDANNVLSDDLQKVTEDWNEAKETLARKEAEWKDEQEVNNMIYFTFFHLKLFFDSLSSMMS